jgi:hypothetical protein
VLVRRVSRCRSHLRRHRRYVALLALFAVMLVLANLLLALLPARGADRLIRLQLPGTQK